MQMTENVVLFDGVNTSGHPGLWETNGTATGTFEIPVTGANASGLAPSNLTAYNGGALFEGRDSSGAFGLWVTNGTAAGTREIAGTSGLSPNNLTVFNGQVLFSGGSGLWTTNGTTASEVTGVAGAPADLTVFGTEVLFAGATGGLWETNGTAGGTTELSGAVNPSDLTVFGGEVLFANAAGGLWETTGGAPRQRSPQASRPKTWLFTMAGCCSTASMEPGSGCGRRTGPPAARLRLRAPPGLIPEI